MDVVDTRFELLAEVATGGMGVIYRARDRQTNRLVALKRLRFADDEAIQRFEREATILARLTHPAIVGYVAHGAAGEPYLAMEWIVGETLRERLDRVGVSIAETVRLGIRIGEALHHAHVHGVIHRDLKPSNVMMRGEDLAQPVLLDFGIARPAGSGKGLTATGALVGTPSYMSPEQARGERTIDGATDIYALGCLLYECATGCKAFEGKHALALVAKVVLWEPVMPARLNPSISPELEALIVQMMAKAPGDRPTSRELPRLLGAIAVAETPAARATRPAPDATARITLHATIAVATTAAGTDGSAGDLDDDVLATRWALAAALIRDYGVRAQALRDGSLVVVAESPDARSAARQALLCGRAIAKHDPLLLVGLASGAGATELLLDGVLAGLAKEAMQRVFSGFAAPALPPGAIRLDAATEALLDEPVVRARGVGYVAGQP